MPDRLTAALRGQASVAVSPAERALAVAARRDADELRDDLQDKASEAAIAGNPSRARYYEEWAARAGA